MTWIQVCISDTRPRKRCWHGRPRPGPWPICISVTGGPQTCRVSAPPATPTYWAMICIVTPSQVVLIHLEMHCWKKTGADLPDSIYSVNLLVKFLFSSWLNYIYILKIPSRRERLPTPVCWPGECHRLYSPWGPKESFVSNFHLTGGALKNPPASAGDLREAGSIPGSGRSPGEGNGNPLQYSCLENPMDRRAWWAMGYGP